MNPTLFVALPILAFSGALMLIVPHISPRRYFFAVTVEPDFPSSGPGRAISRFYHWGTVIDVLLTAVLMLILQQVQPDLTPPAAFLGPVVGGGLHFLIARAKTQRFADPGSVREADLTDREERLPWWIVLALPAFAIPLAVGEFLRAHWNEIPTAMAVHFGITGQADRWAEKTPRLVFGTLLFNAGFLLLILLLGLATYYGARRSPRQMLILKMMVAMSYYISIVFAGLALSPLKGFSPMWVLVLTPLFLILVVVWAYRAARDPNVPSEATPDACWRLGVLYYNPQDPAIFVQKRVGFGYTFNFANRLSWLIMGTFLATAFAFAFVMR